MNWEMFGKLLGILPLILSILYLVVHIALLTFCDISWIVFLHPINAIVTSLIPFAFFMMLIPSWNELRERIRESE